MDNKQEEKNKKEKSNLIFNTISVVVILILAVVGIICALNGVSKYIIAAFGPCSGLISLVLVLRSDSHGIKKVVLIISALIIIVVFPLLYLCNLWPFIRM